MQPWIKTKTEATCLWRCTFVMNELLCRSLYKAFFRMFTWKESIYIHVPHLPQQYEQHKGTDCLGFRGDRQSCQVNRNDITATYRFYKCMKWPTNWNVKWWECFQPNGQRQISYSWNSHALFLSAKNSQCVAKDRGRGRCKSLHWWVKQDGFASGGKNIFSVKDSYKAVLSTLSEMLVPTLP